MRQQEEIEALQKRLKDLEEATDPKTEATDKEEKSAFEKDDETQ